MQDENSSGSFDSNDCPTFTQGGNLHEQGEDDGPRLTVWRHLSRSEKAFARTLARETAKADREEGEVENALIKAQRNGTLGSFEALKASMPLDRWDAKIQEAKAWLESEVGGIFESTMEKLIEREKRRETCNLEKLEEKQVLATGSALADVDWNQEIEKIMEMLDEAIGKVLDRKDND